MKHLIRFAMDGKEFHVIYAAKRDLTAEIEDAVSSYLEHADCGGLKSIVKDILCSFPEIETWNEISCKTIKI